MTPPPPTEDSNDYTKLTIKELKDLLKENNIPYEKVGIEWEFKEIERNW